MQILQIFAKLQSLPCVFSIEFSAVNRRRPSRETSLGPGAKKEGCFRRLQKFRIIADPMNNQLKACSYARS